MTYQVESGVPLPGSDSYPFGTMQPGDSFACGTDEKEASKVRGAATRYGKEYSYKFSVKKGADGSYRCWRTE